MKAFSCVLGMLVAGLLCFVAAGMSISGLIGAYVQYNRADWQTTEARLVSLELERGRLVKYEAEIEFNYSLGGKAYDNTVSVLVGESSSEDRAKMLMAEKFGLRNLQWEEHGFKRHKAILKNDARIIISYHPAFPSRSYYTGVAGEDMPYTAGFGLTMTIICAVMAIAFAAMFMRCLRALRRKEPKQAEENPFADETSA